MRLDNEPVGAGAAKAAAGQPLRAFRPAPSERKRTARTLRPGDHETARFAAPSRALFPSHVLTFSRSFPAHALTFFLCALSALSPACASDHRRAATTHTIESFDPRYTGGLVSREVWSDTERGGGLFLFTDPTAINLFASHTNQSALGGGSLFSAGSLAVTVDTNLVPAITAAGAAAGNIIGAAAKAAVK